FVAFPVYNDREELLMPNTSRGTACRTLLVRSRDKDENCTASRTPTSRVAKRNRLSAGGASMNGTQSSYFRVTEFGPPAHRSGSAGKFHLGLALGVLLMLSSLPAHAQFLTGTVPTGSGPAAIGINPVTNKAYVANASDGTLTIIDGATHSTTSIAVGANPHAVLVNLVTNKIYVANANASGTVTVVDGATNQTTTVVVGGFTSATVVVWLVAPSTTVT